jgi:hypothetical protein
MKGNKMNMFDNKSKIVAPLKYISSVPINKRETLHFLFDEISKAIPNEKPFMISGIIGFSKFKYKYASGKDGDWFVVGLAERKTGYSIYICCLEKEGNQYLVEKYSKEIGKATCGKSCIRFSKLEDINMDVVLKLIKQAVKSPRFGI